MLALTEISRGTQRAACILMAALIVALSFAAGEKSADAGTHRSYSVSVSEM